MEQQSLRDRGPLRWREQFLQVRLDFIGIVRGRKSKPIGDSFHMRINDYRRFPERIAQQDVGGFPSNTGKRDEFVHGCRNVAGEALGQTA